MKSGRTPGSKTTCGFVVKKEEIVSPPGAQVTQRKRVIVSRVYHSRDAAATLMKLLQERNPDVVYYIHEKQKYDESEIA